MAAIDNISPNQFKTRNEELVDKFNLDCPGCDKCGPGSFAGENYHMEQYQNYLDTGNY